MHAPFSVATWNVNSLRARLDHTLKWLAESAVDVVCLQETKMTDDRFPAEVLRDAGYEHLAWHGQPTYNGVAILSKHPLSDVQYGLPDDVDDPQARYVSATVLGVDVHNVYIPNGQAVGSDKFHYKLRWLERLRTRLEGRVRDDHPLILCGDMNIAPDDIDVWDPFVMDGQLLCHPEERRRLEAIRLLGLRDSFREANPFASAFSWWDYRQRGFERNHGVRIDLIFASEVLHARCKDVAIHRHVRAWERPSDHCPVVATFE